jgi:Xaa-Pro aminopeptidase
MKQLKDKANQFNLQRRLKDICKSIRDSNLDSLLISNQANIAYLTGGVSNEAYLLLTPQENFYITDFRYIEEAKQNIKNFTIQKINGSLFNLISRLCQKTKTKYFGFEAKFLSFGEYEKLKEKLGAKIKFIPTYDLVEFYRQIKSEKEIEYLKTATKITTAALRLAKRIIRPGMKEYDLAVRLKRFILDAGANSFSFDIIVASGPNSAFPHHVTTKRITKNNEPILIDMGVDFQGYKSDLTRVFFLGKMTPIFRRIYHIVQRAQAETIRQIKPGVSISKIDNLARQYINRRGYGCYFGHNLGHGIGLQIHEEPHISSKNKNPLMPGMVFTIEPAIYLNGRFGIRLEDMVLVTQKGAEVLSDNLDKSIKNWTNHSN